MVPPPERGRTGGGLSQQPKCKRDRKPYRIVGITKLESPTSPSGHRAVMVYLIQRNDATKLTFARDVDPTYGAAFDAARIAGVEAIALRCKITPDEIRVDKPVPIEV